MNIDWGLVIGAAVAIILIAFCLIKAGTARPRPEAPRRVTARHGYFASNYDEYAADDLEDERVLAGRKREQPKPAPAPQRQRRAVSHPHGKVIQNGRR